MFQYIVYKHMYIHVYNYIHVSVRNVQTYYNDSHNTQYTSHSTYTGTIPLIILSLDTERVWGAGGTMK